MRILVLSFYYPPDIGPGALRAKSIVDALIKEGPANLQIDIITTNPNRYSSLNISSAEFEINKNISVTRVSLPKHKNGIFDQALAFFYYSLAVLRLTSKKKWDIVISTSGRLMTASLGAWVSKKNNSKLYLDIRDLFTDNIKNIFSGIYLRILMPLFLFLEKWTFSSANKISVVSPAFLDHFKVILPNLSPSVYTNGVDKIFFKEKSLINKSQKKITLLYVGNIGDGQGLHKIIPQAANELNHVEFKIIGDGSAKKLLTENFLFKSQNNIKVLNPILRRELLKEYDDADILFVHLNNHSAFKKVIPSKIFEYAASGKPILAGVSGFVEKFLTDQVKGVEIFQPCNHKQMISCFHKLRNESKFYNRSDFCFKYDRERIMKKFALDVLSLL